MLKLHRYFTASFAEALHDHTASPLASSPIPMPRLASASVATIGNFDGLHQGHRALLSQLKSRAAQLKLPSTVMLFEPQPLEYFNDTPPRRLISFRDKLEALNGFGIDNVVCFKFNPIFSRITAEFFVKIILMKQFAIQHLLIGADFQFGAKRAGNVALLQSMAHQTSDFSVEIMPLLGEADYKISSTRVRDALCAGDFAQVEKLLQRPYTLSGRVVYGLGEARQYGCPTANIPLKPNQGPLPGIYAVLAQLPDGQSYPSIAYIGQRPGKSRMENVLEVHLFDQGMDLYGQQICVHFLKQIREDIPFEKIPDIQAQIALDTDATRRYFC